MHEKSPNIQSDPLNWDTSFSKEEPGFNQFGTMEDESQDLNFLESPVLSLFMEARIIFVDWGLDSKLQHYGPCKNSWKKSKASHLDRIGHIEGDVMQNHEQKKRGEEKWKTKISWAKQTIFWEPCPSALGQFQPHGCM
jgi:hypothetical protein